MSYHRLAAARFPGYQITGLGRFALTALDSPKRVWLFETREEASRQIVNAKRCTITDLECRELSDILDSMPDRDSARRR